MPYTGYNEFYGPDAQAQADKFAAGVMGTGGNPFGGIPAPVNPQTAQANSIGGNLSNIASLHALATGAGAASGAGAAANLNTVLPGATAGLEQGLGVATQDLTGQLPADVIAQIQQGAAERGVGTGTNGSPNSNASYLKALGLNSLDLQNTGIKDLSTVIGSTPIGPQFNPNSQLIDPAQQLEQENYNASLAAAPDPAAAARANLSALYGGRGAASSPLSPGGSGAPTDNFWQTDPNSWWRGGGPTSPSTPADFSGVGQNVDPMTGLPIDPQTGEIDWTAVTGGGDAMDNAEAAYME